MRKTLLTIGMALASCAAIAATEIVDGITWTYTVTNGEASVGGGGGYGQTAVLTSTAGAITIPSSLGKYPVTSIGDWAFSRCSALTNVVISEGVASIGATAFAYCFALEDVAIPFGVTNIGMHAFYACSVLGKVALPASVTSIEREAFGCGGITSFTVDEGNSVYMSEDGLLLTKDGKTLVDGVNGDVVIPSHVTIIGDFSFARRGNLTSVVIPNSVTSIGKDAFARCHSLSSITIPSGVTNIGEYAFFYCEGLASIDFEGAPPEGLADSSLDQSVAIRYNAAYAQQWASAIAKCGFTNTTAYVPIVPQPEVWPYPDGGPYAETVDGITWMFTITNGEANAGGISPQMLAVPQETAGDIAIPSTLGGRPVTCIKDEAFSNCDGLTSVTIPEGVLSIGWSVFYDCDGLTNVTISEGLTIIDGHAFNCCDELTSVTMPRSVTSIGESAFEACFKLKSATIPEGVTNIGEYAFSSCPELRFFEVSERNPSYSSCDGFLLSKDGKTLIAGINGDVMIPSGVTSIGDYAFWGYWGLTSVVISSGVTNIGCGAFSGGSGLTSVTIPSSVTSIGEYAFSGCLTAVDFEGAPPDGMGKYTYAVDEDVAIRYNVAYEDEWLPVIEECGFTNAEPYVPPLPDGGPYTEMVDGIEWTFLVTNGEASVGRGGFYGVAIPTSTEGAISIPATLGGRLVTSVGEDAFYCCFGVTDVTMPNSIKVIGMSAFMGCGMTNITISAGTKDIGSYAFYGCDGLVNVTIPSCVTNIGGSAFEQCFKLESVNIPASVTSIGWAPFYDCIVLTNIAVSEDNAYYTSSDGVLFSKDKSVLITFPAGKRCPYEIPLGVTKIQHEAFGACTGLSGVTIPESVTDIGYHAFWNCSGLTHIEIPSSVTCIGEALFQGCSGLTNIVVAADNPVYATENDALLTKDKTLFMACPPGKCGRYEIPSGVTGIDRSAFGVCSNLTEITIPSGVTSIGKWAFSHCIGLEYIALPDSVTDIGGCAFQGCNGLTSITIPSNVTIIGTGAFGFCSGLNAVDFEGAPPEGVEDASIKTDAAIRYNAAYAYEWLPVVEQCGWTNATPYVPPLPDGGPHTETVDGIEWTFVVTNGEAVIGVGGYYGQRAVPTSTTGSVTIPSALGGCPVTSIGDYAFYGCSGLMSVAIPSSVTSIDSSAFARCSGMTSITIPNSVTSIGRLAFYGCSGLMSVTLEGDAPASEANIFTGTPSDMVVHVKGSSSGWTQWNGRVIRFDADSGSGTSATSVNVNMTITNVIVHYIQTSELSPMAAPVTKDVGIVNVMTEVKGGNVSIPESWATNWPTFKATFGEDFSDALTRQTGKFDAGGKPMMVWQDFVAGTDPTDKDNVFKASITTDVNGNLIISYTPKLSEAEKAKRKYTTWGKVKLRDEKWIEVPAGREDDYNFFKVTVEMR